MVMREHLWRNGLTIDYTQWVYHGDVDHMRGKVATQRGL
jgi:hypothetical protein